MQSKKHLRLLSEKQLEKIIPMKFKYGFPQENEDEEDEPKNYYKIAQSLNTDKERFFEYIEIKNQRRNKVLDIPNYIDHIIFTFHGQFVISDYFENYYNDYFIVVMQKRF